MFGNIQEHTCIRMQLLSYKFREIKKLVEFTLTIKLRYRKTSKISLRAYISQRSF